MQGPSEHGALCDCTGDTSMKPALGVRYHFTEEAKSEKTKKSPADRLEHFLEHSRKR